MTYLQSTAKEYQLLKIELENKITENTNLGVMLADLRSKEQKYVSLIEQARRHEDEFSKSFKEAHEFLRSQPLIEKVQDEYKSSIDPFTSREYVNVEVARMAQMNRNICKMNDT